VKPEYLLEVLSVDFVTQLVEKGNLMLKLRRKEVMLMTIKMMEILILAMNMTIICTITTTNMAAVVMLMNFIQMME